MERVIESGTSSKIGTRYSAKLGATYLDEQRAGAPDRHRIVRIGPARIVASAIEQRHARGRHRVALVYRAHPSPPRRQRSSRRCARWRSGSMGDWRGGVRTILDDRDERPGVSRTRRPSRHVPIQLTVGALLGQERRGRGTARQDRQDVAVAPDGVVAAVRPRQEAGRRLPALHEAEGSSAFLSEISKRLTQKSGAAHFRRANALEATGGDRHWSRGSGGGGRSRHLQIGLTA